MSSLPGGPSILSVCIHAGWTMGTVKDVYMQYLSSGDQFVSHCGDVAIIADGVCITPPPPPLPLPPILFRHGMTGGNLQCSAVPYV